MGKVFVGQDWAEAHHDVYVEDAEGHRLARARLPEGVEGVARFHDLVAPFVEEPAEVVVATETDRGLFVGALVAAGYQVIAVNPLSTSRYRERHSTSGAKSDPGDARVLAELARTDAHDHRQGVGVGDVPCRLVVRRPSVSPSLRISGKGQRFSQGRPVPHIRGPHR
jgi:transposase